MATLSYQYEIDQQIWFIDNLNIIKAGTIKQFKAKIYISPDSSVIEEKNYIIYYKINENYKTNSITVSEGKIFPTLENAIAYLQNILITTTLTPTPTISLTPSTTPTPSVSSSFIPESATPTPTITPTLTPTISPTLTPTITVTPTITPTITPTVTPTMSTPAFIAFDSFTNATYPQNITARNTPVGNYAWTTHGSQNYDLVDGGFLEQTINGDGFTTINVGESDGVIQCTFFQDAGSGIIFRFSNVNNYFKATIENNTLIIIKIDGGIPTQVGSTSLSINFPIQLKVTLNGSSITAQANGSTLNVIETHNQNATGHGIDMINLGNRADDFGFSLL